MLALLVKVDDFIHLALHRKDLVETLDVDLKIHIQNRHQQHLAALAATVITVEDLRGRALGACVGLRGWGSGVGGWGLGVVFFLLGRRGEGLDLSKRSTSAQA